MNAEEAHIDGLDITQLHAINRLTTRHTQLFVRFLVVLTAHSSLVANALYAAGVSS